MILSFFLHVVALYTFSGFDYFYMGVEDYNGGWFKSIFVYLFTCIGGVTITSLCFSYMFVLPVIYGLIGLTGLIIYSLVDAIIKMIINHYEKKCEEY